MSVRLEMKHMTKKYGDFFANENVSLTVKKGEVHAIVGENGAGKTTLMRMLYGMEKPDSGQIILDGNSMNFNGPDDAIKNGIGMVHQHFMLFPDFTAAENIVIGHEPGKMGFFHRKQAEESVKALAEQYKISVRPSVKAVKCSVGEQQRIEILKVLYQGAEIIILDEPTAVLTPIEVEKFLEMVKHLAEQGKSIILITHKLREVMEVADQITVLRNGKVTGAFAKKDTTMDELARRMVGRELQKLSTRVKLPGGSLLEVKNITVKEKDSKPVLNDVSFSVHHGEIVGIAGVSGNGQSELLQVISGLRRADEGTVTLGGKEITNKSVRSIRETGVSHIPEDRYLWGAAKDAAVDEVAIMGFYDKPKYRQYSFLKKKLFGKVLKGWIEKFDIRMPSGQPKAGNLSGGNLQKLIAAREIAHESPFLIAAEPTRGVDIGAMEIIHEQLIAKRNNGDGILLVSSELSEILALSDRILVMYEGEIAGGLDRKEATEEIISLLMAGGKQHDISSKASATV
jgi:ABC-type uncharacterized transport system ATPase subunit